MRIYLASSWKNKPMCLSLTSLMRLWGHEVNCFCEPRTGEYVFDVRDVGAPSEIDAISFLDDPRAKKAFTLDKFWIDWSDAVVMLFPCGNSSHLEAGYAVGSGKKLFMFGDFPLGEFDVMYGFADLICRELSVLRKALSGDLGT